MARVDATVEITITVEVDLPQAEEEWTDLKRSRIVGQAVQNMIGHTGAIVEEVNYWSVGQL
jgi:hypothetical protein